MNTIWQRMERIFKDAHPRAVDIPMADYRRNEHIINSAARTLGYRFVGERLGRAVFSTKPARGGSA